MLGECVVSFKDKEIKMISYDLLKEIILNQNYKYSSSLFYYFLNECYFKIQFLATCYMQELNLDPKKRKNLCPLYSIQPNMHKRKHLYVILNAKTNSIGPNKGLDAKSKEA